MLTRGSRKRLVAHIMWEKIKYRTHLQVIVDYQVVYNQRQKTAFSGLRLTCPVTESQNVWFCED